MSRFYLELRLLSDLVGALANSLARLVLLLDRAIPSVVDAARAAHALHNLTNHWVGLVPRLGLRNHCASDGQDQGNDDYEQF